jgi:hypothetical protein
MGGYGIPDDANVHFLSPITAISICLETSQGKNYRLICALPLGMDIRKKRSIVKVVGPTFTHHFVVVVAHSRPAIPCSVLFIKIPFQIPRLPFSFLCLL